MKQFDVDWKGTPKRLWSRLQVVDHGDDADAFETALHTATLVSVDPGDPVGVAVVPYSHKWPLTLHTLPMLTFAQLFACTTAYDVVCEQPLFGQVRVYDPNPWRVRGFVELTCAGRRRAGGDLGMFVSADVGWLTAGYHMAFITGLPYDHRHAKDALAYAAMAVASNVELRDHQHANLGVPA